MSTARWRIVRFDRPRKSILSRPILARLSAWYWVIRLASLREVGWSGVYSGSGSAGTTTPAAGVEAWRGKTSAPLAAGGHVLYAPAPAAGRGRGGGRPRDAPPSDPRRAP